MPKVFKTSNLDFELRDSRIPEFKWHTTPRLAKIVNSKFLQFDIRSLDPGKFSFPYHFHHASEELFMIISGEATLRTPEGFEKVGKDDIVFFEIGPTSAHQLYNHTDVPCVYLDIRASAGIDFTEYPDSKKINILPLMEIYEKSSKVDYYHGEENVSNNWPDEIINK
jgi:uncharacterized cupin superfamily protein